MKNAKYVIAGAALLGLLAMFLPYVKLGEESMRFWDFRSIPGGEMQGLLNGPKQVYLALFGFLVPLALGGLAIARSAQRWQGILSTLFFLIALATEGVRKGFGAEGVSTAIGGKLLLIATLVGIIASIAVAAVPERGRA